jgi:multiple sugar transport system substrate-binding protein
MKHLKTLSLSAVVVAASAVSAQSQELHMILCGGEIRAADQAAVDQFEAENPGATVNVEAVPWGTCQDKSKTLAAAGDPPSLSYMGSRTLRQLANADLIVPAQISDKARETYYDPLILNTVTVEGTEWGYPHAFSTKALFINCGLVEEAGLQCVAPRTWNGMYNMAKAITDNTDAAGFGMAGKDFDSSMHMFLNFLYSNGGTVIDSATGENMLDSSNTRETLAMYERMLPVSQEGPTAWERGQLKELFNDSKIGMYVSGPWGRGEINDSINHIAVPIPAGPQGKNGTLLITDSIAVFKGSGHEELAHKLAQIFTTGANQYSLDTEWGLTPLFDYTQWGIEDPYYKGDAYWSLFVDAIANGGPEPLVEDFKALQSAFTNMIQGIILKDDTVDNLVTIAGEELADAL